MLHTLYQQSLKARSEFFIEFFALDLLMDQDGTCCGVMAWDLSTGQLHRYRAKQVILDTGGYGRAYFSATSAHTCTGDGTGMALPAGIARQDIDRKSVVSGKSVSVRVDLGGRRNIQKK